MASVYGYITLGNLENYTGLDYSTIDSVALADVKIEKKITDAERMVNAYLGVSAGVTKTDAVIITTMMLSAKICHNSVISLGYLEGTETEHDELLGMSIKQILDTFLGGSKNVMIDSIPMSGASYHKPDSRM